jgi:arylsulfatase A-like enzyme
MRRPNIVFILVDDMGYGDIGKYSQGATQTPALDQLMSEGLTLTQHYSCSPVCAPARAGLLTGRYPHRTGAIDTLDLRGLDRIALREVTIADVFKSAGYATGLIGKWHSGKGAPDYHPNARGFDEFVGFSGGWSNFYDYKLDYNGKRAKSDGSYMTDVFTEEAIQFIRRHKHDPFFLKVSYNAPHWPLQCPEEDVKPFRDTGKFSEEVSTLYGMIYRMDKGIARILEELRVQGVEEDTLVVFTSDNGPDFDSGGPYWGQPEVSVERYNAGFKGHKYLVYEGGIRVPAIVRWPSGLGRTGESSALWHFTDWFPTLLEAAGIPIPSDVRLDGNNLLPILQGRIAGMPTTRFWQWNRYTPLATCNAAMREEGWKLVRPEINKAMQVLPEDVERERLSKSTAEGSHPLVEGPLPIHDIDGPAKPMLFRIDDDPYEQYDVSDQHPERVSRMLRKLEDWYDSVEAERKSITE